jgi:hypothetical protein
MRWRRLRAAVSHPPRPGGLGSSSGPTTWLCRSDGWTRPGRRRAKARRIRDATAPVLSRKHGPLAPNRRDGAPQGDALPPSHEEARQHICALRRSVSPPAAGRCSEKSLGRARREDDVAWSFSYDDSRSPRALFDNRRWMKETEKPPRTSKSGFRGIDSGGRHGASCGRTPHIKPGIQAGTRSNRTRSGCSL